MIYIGIDIAKKLHVAAAISSDGEVILEPFELTNDSDGLLKLLSEVIDIQKDELIIGLESTATLRQKSCCISFQPQLQRCCY